MSVSPPEEELKDALVTLKHQNPSLGISKIYALLLRTYPSWTVSEKRTRKILQNEGLVLSSTPIKRTTIAYPSSRVIPHLDVTQWTNKVEVSFFDQQKGKGLIATSDIEEGEVIWKEDPFIIAPEWYVFRSHRLPSNLLKCPRGHRDLFDLQMKSTACAYCSTPLVDSPIAGSPIPCPASISSAFCPARFCNRLCLSRSAKTHPLLCPAQNPASVPLLKWTRDGRWMALHALAQCMSRILLANQKDEATLRADWEVMRGLAALGMEERFNYSFKS